MFFNLLAQKIELNYNHEKMLTLNLSLFVQIKNDGRWIWNANLRSKFGILKEINC